MRNKYKRYNVYREGKCVECGHKSKYWIANVGVTCKEKAIKRAKEDWHFVRFMNSLPIDEQVWEMFLEGKFTAKEDK